ncbi:DNA polymerase delta subunit 3 [Sabethes cyaneus]|uniref:DNA polymerase delta subunit 3 n=1 Tax=Sabethes cyaneus TaxID=53552 RepID=UPI00237DEE25|nr:DNA polymerase delta subunit 3 [Sabethes cyaneus]
MDAVMEKTCYDDISHTVLDARHKMTVRSISNNYGLSFGDAVKVLQQWIDKNSAKAKLIKEYIIRGVFAQQGNAFITVVNEQKLKTIESKTKRISSMLYSVELAAESSRPLNIPEEQEFRVINLSLQADKRSIEVFTPKDTPPVTVKQEPKSKITSMFSAGTSKTDAKPASVKEEKLSPKAAVKQESPTAGSPKKSPVKTSPTKKRDAKKPVTGKGSIASFFNNKPATKTAASPVPSLVKQEKFTPKKEESREETKTNGKREDESQRWKRMISDESDDDDVIPNTPQDKKTQPKKTASKKLIGSKKESKQKKENPSKKSRIMQIDDSSEDEEEKPPKEPEEREVQFDAEESNDVEMKETEKQASSPEQSAQSATDRKKAMVKKMVTRTFQDEEGYLITVKEYEMVEEDEADEASGKNNNNDASEKKATQNGTVDHSKGKTSEKVVDKKPAKVTPPTPKTKQGSITSFFSKK